MQSTAVERKHPLCQVDPNGSNLLHQFGKNMEKTAMTTATRKESTKTVGAPRTLMLIDGAWVESAKAEFLPVANPANRQVIGEVPRAGEEDVDRAVQSAARAFEKWKRVAPRERGKLLMMIADAIEAQSEALALLIATETGNAIRTQSRPEAKGAADIFGYFAGLASELKGETVPLGEHVLSYT
ncbi:MAG: aldehyde dehydrogenase family protein, partial [Acidiferrobacterales bacterium]